MARDLDVIEKHEPASRVGVELLQAGFPLLHRCAKLDGNTNAIPQLQCRALKGAFDKLRGCSRIAKVLLRPFQVVITEHAESYASTCRAAVLVDLLEDEGVVAGLFDGAKEKPFRV